VISAVVRQTAGLVDGVRAQTEIGDSVMSTDLPVCMVAGASSGIGRATAECLAAKGLRVALVGRSTAKLEETRRSIEHSGGVAEAWCCDVRNFEEVRSTVDLVAQRLGAVEILVNSASLGSLGVTMRRMEAETVKMIVDTNLVGAIFLAHAVLPGMLGMKRGTIVNVSSMSVKDPGSMGGPAYCATKAGVLDLTRYLNNELKNSGVRACCVLPASTDTPLWESNPVPPLPGVRATMLQPADVAAAIAFVALMPDRACVEELYIRPTIQADRSREKW